MEEAIPGDVDQTTLPKLAGKAKKPAKKSTKKPQGKSGTVKGDHMKGHGCNHLMRPC